MCEESIGVHCYQCGWRGKANQMVGPFLDCPKCVRLKKLRELLRYARVLAVVLIIQTIVALAVHGLASWW